MSDKYAYKILRNPEYAAFKAQGHFSGSTVDIQDGFIHLSLASQLQGTLDKHYTDGVDLTLAEVELELCAGDIKFEVSRGGAAFPHLYAPLQKSALKRIWPLTADATGRYELPADLEM